MTWFTIQRPSLNLKSNLIFNKLIWEFSKLMALWNQNLPMIVNMHTINKPKLQIVEILALVLDWGFLQTIASNN